MEFYANSNPDRQNQRNSNQRDSDVDFQICQNMFDTLNHCATVASLTGRHALQRSGGRISSPTFVSHMMISNLNQNLFFGNRFILMFQLLITHLPFSHPARWFRSHPARWFRSHPARWFRSHPARWFRSHPAGWFRSHPARWFRSHPARWFRSHPARWFRSRYNCSGIRRLIVALDTHLPLVVLSEHCKND